LRDDGVIFISIDDNEVTNLRKLCDDVFGVENFVAEFIWKKKQGGGNDSNLVVVEHEYIVSYRKSEMAELYLDKKYKLDDNLYPNKDEKGEYGLITLDKSSIQFSQSLVFEIVDKDGNKYTPRIVKGKQSCWRWSKAKVEAEFDDLVFKNGKVYTKYYRPEGIKPKSLLIDTIYGRTESGNDDIKSLFEVSPFSYPKPIDLINHFSSISTQSDDIILDFFSGSATTAHAVMQLNAEDGGNRRFICVQFPETTDNPDYPTICEIGKERIRRAGDKIKADNPLTTEELDIGFRVFRTADTNIRWTDMAIRGEQIDFDEAALSDKDRLDFMPNFTDIDVVYEVLLRQRDIPLSAAVEKLDIGERVWLFADSYVVCLDEEITVGLVEALAAIEPAPIKYVLRDSAFNDDISLKDETIRRLEAYIARNSGEQKVAYTVEFI
jgi:adenine-specific DNA-methyltransferase